MEERAEKYDPQMLTDAAGEIVKKSKLWRARLKLAD